MLSITNLVSTTNSIYIGFYDAEDAFPKFGKHSFQKIIEPNGKEVSQSWDDIPAGEYAIAVFQDLNENKNMERNFFGMPKEPYGFSTNFKAGIFSLPSYNKCKVKIDQENDRQTISLIN